MENVEKFFDVILYHGIEFPPFPAFANDIEGRLDAIKNYQIRKDDVLLSTHPKSGTHWLFDMLNMLTKGNTEHTGALENHFLEIVDSFKTMEELPSPRILSTHLPYQFLPEVHRKHGAKVVHLVRNPKDLHVSLFYHLQSICTNKIPWATYIDNVIQRKDLLLGGWSAFERTYEEAAEQNENIFIMYYENLLQHPVQELQKLVKFLELSCDESFLINVVNKCSFANLKKIDETDDQTDRTQRDLINQMKGFESRPSIFRKGIIGDWKNIFTVSQSERYDAVLQEDMELLNLKCLSKYLPMY